MTKKEKKLVMEACSKMKVLMEKENDRMIRQNERERKNEKGKSCFDTAIEGAKILRNQNNN